MKEKRIGSRSLANYMMCLKNNLYSFIMHEKWEMNANVHHIDKNCWTIVLPYLIIIFIAHYYWSVSRCVFIVLHGPCKVGQYLLWWLCVITSIIELRILLYNEWQSFKQKYAAKIMMLIPCIRIISDKLLKVMFLYSWLNDHMYSMY